MALFVLNYDLVNESKGTHDYQPLWDELKRLKAQRTQYSTWLIDLNNSPREVVEHFKQFVDKDDRLMVVKLTKEHWYTNAIGGTNAWLEAHKVT